jgi:putative spermidine/putrescine transport system permease protein
MRAVRATFVALVCLFSLAPLIVVFGAAVTTESYFSFPPRGFGIGWVQAALETEAFRSALWNSVRVTVVVTLIAGVLGYMGARTVLDPENRYRGVISGVLESPLMIPGIIIGFAGALFLPSVGLGSPFVSSVIGLTVFTLPFAMRALASSLATLNPSHREAAITMGAGPIRVWTRIIAPQLLPGIVSAGVFAFVLAFDNVTISLWMAAPGFTLVPLWLLSYMEASSSPLPAAAGAIAAVINLVAFGILLRLGGIDAIVGGSRA